METESVFSVVLELVKSVLAANPKLLDPNLVTGLTAGHSKHFAASVLLAQETLVFALKVIVKDPQKVE